MDPKFEIDPDDIFIERGINSLPDEMLNLILIFVPDVDLKNCLCVCRRWLKMVSTAPTFWKEKCLRKCYILPEHVTSYGPQDYESWRNLYFLKPFSRNLIQNPSGADGLEQNWRITNNGGEGWVVEDKTVGAKNKPEDLLIVSNGSTANFATSYGWDEMEQTIDLEKEGCSLKLLDELQPEIYVSEWYTERFDCGCYYDLRVELYSENNADAEPIEEHHYESGLIPQWSDSQWKKTEHTFKNYGKGVRYIRFVHAGKDSQFWAGHYGSKIAGAQVRVFADKPTCLQ